MIMKKIISTLLAISLVLMFLPNSTFATEMADVPETSGGVAEVNGVTYETLLDAINAAYEAGSGQTITLLKNYEVETGEWVTYLMPENSTLDLKSFTLTVPYAKAVFEGKNITIQNGRFESDASYSIWIGNGENETSVTIKDLSSNAGANVLAADVTLENCNLNAGGKGEYYSVWADDQATIKIKSGEYVGGENGVVGAFGESGQIDIWGGSFTFGVFAPSGNDNVSVHAGEFSDSIDKKYLASGVNLVKIGDKWEALDEDKTVENEDGSTTETKSEVAEDGSSTVTETVTKKDESTGIETVEETVTKRDADGSVVETVSTAKEITSTENVTTTEQTVTTTSGEETTVVTTKIVEDATTNITVTTNVEDGCAKAVAKISDVKSELPSSATIDATAAKADADKVVKSEVSFTSETLSSLNGAVGTDGTLSIKTDVATMSVDNEALETLTSKASTDTLVLELEKTDKTVDEAKLITATYELTALVNGKPVFTDDTQNSGVVTVSVPYKLTGGDNGVDVYYVPTNGEKVKMSSTFKDNVLSWKTNHFSTFEIEEVATEPDPEPEIDTYSVTFNTNGGSNVDAQTVESGKCATKPADPTKSGYTFAGWYSDSALTKVFDFSTAITSNVTLYAKWTEVIQTKTMHRLYNQWTGEHFYTSDTSEHDNLVKIGWTDEGTGWIAPETSSKPVYRLFNKFVEGGDHLFTLDASERDSLVKAGWTDEGIGWYSDDGEGVPLYRQYNPYSATGTHNYTTSKDENDNLVKEGWRAEGTSWYGVK